MPNDVLTYAIDRLADDIDLSESEAESALEQIMSGSSSEVQTAGFMIALRTKGETVEEIVGLARTMRRFSLRVSVAGSEVVDTCGTGGDKSHSFNISTTAAFVVAGAEARVAKHGNRSATSQCGSADVLEALGADLELSPEATGRCIEQTGIGFMFAPLHHQAMKHVIPVRKELAVRTIFNFLGPLTNPAGAAFQLIGVSDPNYLRPMASALQRLGCRHGLVVHGSDGLDEITVTGVTEVVEVTPDEIRGYTITPEDFGINSSPETKMIKGGTAGENAAIIRSILAGETGVRRDIVLLNAGAALYTAGASKDIGEGIRLAAASIDSGAAVKKLEAFIEATRTA
ncbi:MAG: anthranilate phosphoribosyltransferase [Actinobacteria bacterium]|nr:anthranilate phosphoribosyltransferase [Actinomycetota bacterium]